jgi:predicted RNA binding protein YcfA (HicA-like mRNA interferase family)
VAKSVVLKPREVISGLRKLGFELLPKRGKGSHLFAVTSVICTDDEPHTIRVTIPRYKRDLHPDTLASICARTRLTAEKLKQAARGTYRRGQYERELSQTPKVDLLSPEQRATHLKRRGN